QTGKSCLLQFKQGVFRQQQCTAVKNTVAFAAAADQTHRCQNLQMVAECVLANVQNAAQFQHAEGFSLQYMQNLQAQLIPQCLVQLGQRGNVIGLGACSLLSRADMEVRSRSHGGTCPV